MIKITLTTGLFRGMTRTSADIAKQGMSATQYINYVLCKFWHWEIDYSSAEPEEREEWGRADIEGRLMLAMKEGRPVHIGGKVWRGGSEKAFRKAYRSFAGKPVDIERDDDRGLWIVIGGNEHKPS